MSVSPELIFELLLKVPNHSELFLFELKSKFDRFKRDVIDEIRTQELIHNFWKFINQTIELCLPANYITMQINKKALELTAELTMAKVHINDYQQHAKASKHMEQASIIVSEIMILLIENITSSTNCKAMMAVATIPSVLGIDAPITLQELKEKMKGLKTKCLDEAITKERAAYDIIKSPSKKVATGIYFCDHEAKEHYWVCVYCQNSVKKQSPDAHHQIALHQFLCVRKPQKEVQAGLERLPKQSLTYISITSNSDNNLVITPVWSTVELKS